MSEREAGLEMADEADGSIEKKRRQSQPYVVSAF